MLIVYCNIYIIVNIWNIYNNIYDTHNIYIYNNIYDIHNIWIIYIIHATYIHNILNMIYSIQNM